MLRRFIRNSAEWLLVESGWAGRSRRRTGDHAAIAAYHNVYHGPHPGGDSSLHLGLEDFRSQVDQLRTTHEIVPLSALAATPPHTRPLAAITFDDAYAGALRYAVPELVERQVPATIFACPGLLGAPGFWWDALALVHGGLDDDQRKHALTSGKGRNEVVLSDARGEVDLPPDLKPGTVEELRDATSHSGITLASHTWGHPNLAALPAGEVEEELRRSRHWLMQHFPDSTLPTHVSFPYGLYDEDVVRIATELGFDHLYRIEGGLARMEGEPPHLLPRINVPAGVSLRGFELRTSGVLS